MVNNMILCVRVLGVTWQGSDLTLLYLKEYINKDIYNKIYSFKVSYFSKRIINYILNVCE